jgi:hypothetical protein
VIEPVQLRLTHDARSRQGAVVLVKGTDGEPVTVLSWTGEAPSLQYQDEQGQWLGAWPPSDLGERPRRPPQRVRIDLDEAVGGPLWVSVVDTERPRPRLRDWVD